jgi:hypothetical protein
VGRAVDEAAGAPVSKTVGETVGQATDTVGGLLGRGD